MKRSELKVGEHYAVYHPTENPLWRNVARVEVLHAEPWREAPRAYLSHAAPRMEPTPGGKGRGVHVRVVEGHIRGHPMLGPAQDETVVPTSMIRSTWVEHEAAERERERQEEENKVLRAARSAEWQLRVDAVLAVLAEAGVELSVGVPHVYGDGSHNNSWRIYMDDMEVIAEVIKKGSS